MASINARLLRRDLMQLKAWVEHWKADVDGNFLPTTDSLMLAKSHAESALALLDRMEAEKEIAA